MMKHYLSSILAFGLFLQSCGQSTVTNSQETKTSSKEQEKSSPKNLIVTEGKVVENRILTPEGFERSSAEASSFSEYLRQLPVKPNGSVVKLFNGQEKSNKVYDAVIDLPIGKRDLHQCADAVMRLRAEYLWQQKQFDKIHFNFTNGFRADYSEWMKGKRISVKGNNVSWYDTGKASNTYEDFWKYLEMVFTYAGTLSLSRELKFVKVEDMQPGDVFIRGGSPGHAVIVLDMSVNSQTNKKIFLLAQSYMPAQEIQILKNPANLVLSPWYNLDFGDNLDTPEWPFQRGELMRFAD